MSITKCLLGVWMILGLCASTLAQNQVRIYDVAEHGLSVGCDNATPALEALVAKIRSEYRSGDSTVIRFHDGVYHFRSEGGALRTYYISNHDQTNPKRVGLPLEGMKKLTVEGNGARFVFHGRMLPIALINSEDCTLQDFSIDFETPHITQVRVVASDPEQGITFEPAPWVRYQISRDSIFEVFGYGEGWELEPRWGVPFEPETKRLAYNIGDRACVTKGAYQVGTNRVRAPGWRDEKLRPGMIFAMRGWGRPTPGIFLSHDTNTRLLRIRVHYAEGMGLLAQMCEDVLLDGFSVCLKGDDDPRYFTTQADATHFSGCKGKIISRNGLYEGMMDDAINVHGTYLKVVKRVNDHTVVGRYMHDQTWGFEWGRVGDQLQLIAAKTMDVVGDTNEIVAIQPYDKSEVAGAREFLIRLARPLPPQVSEKEGYGIENLTWTPEVEFIHNVVRNNRARGALFSTPRRTVVEHNLFDHTSGTAILLCGDCNGWYETGACREVVIRHNKFVNALTSLYQFTNAVISIYPEIPDLKGQRGYFHGGSEEAIVIEENVFESFDVPILYAKSVDGLVFRRNIIRANKEYKPFHPNRSQFRLDRVTNVKIDVTSGWDTSY